MDPVGVEPTTNGLKVHYATNCVTNPFYKIIKIDKLWYIPTRDTITLSRVIIIKKTYHFLTLKIKKIFFNGPLSNMKRSFASFYILIITYLLCYSQEKF